MAVIGRYVALDARGVGSCPFKEHHYRGDMRPSFQVSMVLIPTGIVTRSDTAAICLVSCATTTISRHKKAGNDYATAHFCNQWSGTWGRQG